jgi:hypothetical protein
MSAHQVNLEALLLKLEQMGISPKSKYHENHAVIAVEAFLAANDSLCDESEVLQEAVLSQDELAYILLAFAGCKV